MASFVWRFIPRYCRKCHRWLIPFALVPNSARKDGDFDFKQVHYCYRWGWNGVHFK